MKLWKKIALTFFAVILLVQIPFIYNRFQTGELAGKVSSLRDQRTNPANQNYSDLKGIIHAHTSLGGHSTGKFDELIEGAAVNDLDFVVMTEHTATALRYIGSDAQRFLWRILYLSAETN